MKWLLTFFLILVLFVLPTNMGVIAHNSELQISETYTTGILKNEITGQQYQIPVKVKTYNILGSENYEREYEADIPSSILTSQTQEKTIVDPTLSTRIYIYQSYQTKTSGGLPYVSVNYYKGKWQQLDSTVRCTSMNIIAGVYGEPEGGGSPLNKTETKTYLNPTHNVYYQYTPTWAGKYYSVNDIYNQRGTTKAYLLRGATTWSFSVTACVGASFTTC